MRYFLSITPLLIMVSLGMNINAQILTPCEAGFAGIYPCSGYDLASRLNIAQLGGSGSVEGADIWGWTDPLNGDEYAIVCLTNGTAFVDVTVPTAPVYLGKLPTHTSNSLWRDAKVYANHAFIVSEAGSHGMQVFDLTRLRNVTAPPVTFTEDGHYAGFGSAHNIVIDEDSGYAYGVGTSSFSGGLHFVNIQNPTSPVAAGGFSDDGYTHDAQVVVYHGPDAAYVGKEICFASNEDTFTIIDVDDKTDPTQVSRTGYAGSSYTHQGWATEDHRFYLMDDELDESNSNHNTRTYIWNIEDLNAPIFLGYFQSNIASIDHNLYIKGDKAYQANYTGGLRVLDINNIATGNLTEYGYFDVYPNSNGRTFNGAWSNYPFFESGSIIISSIEGGLFVVQESSPATCPKPNALAANNVNASGATCTWNETGAASLWDIAIVAAGTAFNGQPTVNDLSNTSYSFTTGQSGSTYSLYVRADCDGALGNDESTWTAALSFSIPSDYCSGDLFTDAGGVNGTYGDNVSETYLICASGPNEYVSMEFLLVDIEVNSGGSSVIGGCYDYLSIYNGPSNASPVLASPRCGELDGDGQTPFIPSSLLQAGDTFISSDASGCLTLEFFSDGSVVEQGWEALITCIPIVQGCQAPSGLDVIEIDFGTNNPKVNATWNNTEGTSSCEVRGGRISDATAGTANPAFQNMANTRILNQTNGSTVSFNVALYNNPNIPFTQGKTYGYDVRCQCNDGSGFSAWSGIFPSSTFIVPVQPAINNGAESLVNDAVSLIIYPNPIQHNRLQWSVQGILEGSFQIQISDALGRIVHSERMQSGQGALGMELPIVLKGGIYQMTMTSNSELISRTFIVE